MLNPTGKLNVIKYEDPYYIEEILQGKEERLKKVCLSKR